MSEWSNDGIGRLINIIEDVIKRRLTSEELSEIIQFCDDLQRQLGKQAADPSRWISDVIGRRRNRKRPSSYKESRV